MSTIINGTSSAITFPDSSVQNTSAIVSGYVPYANLPAGSVLQVVQGTTLTTTSTSSTSYVQTNLTASITPKFSTSRIMILVSTAVYFNNTGGYGFYTVYRNNTTNLGTGGIPGLAVAACPFQANVDVQINMMAFDTPATTSATTYTVWGRGNAVGNTIMNDNQTTNSIILLEIAA